MTVLAWDQVGERRFETGVDHAVLYLPDGGAVPWNGLDSVNEKVSQDLKSFYTDSIKYLDHTVAGAFSASLKAYTYPDELTGLIGVESFAPGVFIHDQRSRAFSLSYRTKVGNDLDGIDYGYKIHILYNVLATASDIQYSSLGDQLTPQLFEWLLNGTPQPVQGIHPTSHISLHSRSLDPVLLTTLEEQLYGTDTTPPVLLPLPELLAQVEGFYP